MKKLLMIFIFVSSAFLYSQEDKYEGINKDLLESAKIIDIIKLHRLIDVEETVIIIKDQNKNLEENDEETDEIDESELEESDIDLDSSFYMDKLETR